MGGGGTQENGQFQKLRQLSRNELWKNIGCLMSAPTFGLGGSRMWEKNPEISGKKISKVDLYKVCASLFQFFKYYFYVCVNWSQEWTI